MRSGKGIVLSIGLAGWLAISGCGVGQAVVERAGNDLERTSELAKKYNKPEVAKCADFLLARVKKLQATDAQLEALRAEPTEGLLSSALKAALVADLLREQIEGDRATFEKDFNAACNAVAGEIMLKVLQDAGKISKRVS